METILIGVFLFNCVTNLIKIHSTFIEVLSTSCFVLFLVTTDGRHLGLPNCKQSNWLHVRIVVTIPLRFSLLHFFVTYFSNRRCHPISLFLLNFEPTQ